MGIFCHTRLHLNPSSSQVEHGMRLKSQELSFSSLVSLPSKRLAFSSCCFVLAPVAVHPETSSLWLYSVSSLPVSPSSPPVIIIITYGSATHPHPNHLHSQSGYFHQWTTELFYSLFPLQDLCKSLFGEPAYLTAELYLWYLLNLACPFKWPCRYQTCNGCSHWIKSTEWRFKLYSTPPRWLTGFLAVLCNHSWIFVTFEKLHFDLKCHDVPGCFELPLMRTCKAIC